MMDELCKAPCDLECYINWVHPKQYEEKCGYKASRLLDKLEDAYHDLLREEGVLKYKSTEIIGNRGACAYTHIFLRKLEDAQDVINHARGLIHVCARNKLVDEDYLTGFQYVFECLEFFIDTRETVEEREKKVKRPMYGHLNKKSKAAVLALKFHFCRYLGKDVYDRLKILGEMIRLDYHYFEWHWYRMQMLRWKNRLTVRENERKDRQEARELALMKSLAPKDHPCQKEVEDPDELTLKGLNWADGKDYFFVIPEDDE